MGKMYRVAKDKNFDFHALAEFRYQIRRYVSFSQNTARGMGIDPQQHQLMLAVRGLPPALKPTIRTLAERLQIRHHSTVELIDRSVDRGLVERRRDGVDRRQVTIHLTPKGERLLNEAAQRNKNELHTAGRELVRVLRALLRHTEGRARPRKAEG
jgi:DNA-binding MarR family transcriptional regulator